MLSGFIRGDVDTRALLSSYAASYARALRVKVVVAKAALMLPRYARDVDAMPCYAMPL